MTNDIVISATREHKDRLFNFIFGREENKKWTLALYNAVNGSNHEDESQIEFNTLENYLYVSMKNDTSFLFADYVSLYEHQSTFNPNMPLRMMQYISAMYERYVTANDLNKYGSDLLLLPTPRLVVFYNGSKNQPDVKILKLSDSFSKETKSKADIEVRVKMLNINQGHNTNLMDACRPLYEYSWFVDKVRTQKEGINDLENTVSRAVQTMPDEFILKPFLKKHMSEVAIMLSEELQELNAKELIARASEKKGMQKGIQKGMQKGLQKGMQEGLQKGLQKGITDTNTLYSWLFAQDRANDVKKAASDINYMEKLMAEYNNITKEE